MFNKINRFIGENLANAMTSMQCAYIVAVIVTYAVIKSPPKDLLGLSNVLVCSYFQGVGLSLLGYASNLASEKVLKKIEDIWQWQKESHDELKTMHEELHIKIDRLDKDK